MEASINESVFKVLGLMPLTAPGDQLWKCVLNKAYSVCLIVFLMIHQMNIYHLYLERELTGLFISFITLLTSTVILVQAMVSAIRLPVLLQELEQIDHTMHTLGIATNTPGCRRYSAMFYTTYIIGVSRGIYRTTLMIQLGMRSPWVALQLLVPSMIMMARIGQQIYMMELFGAQLQLMVNELAVLFADDYVDAYTNDSDGDFRYRIERTLQRMEHIFGRLQKCLLTVNNLFGWSTAALVVFAFIIITFLFRSPVKPLPVFVQIFDLFYAIMWLLFLCRASSNTTAKVYEMRRLLLKPLYHASQWERIQNFVVQIKLQPFEFTANGLYAINYGLFSSTLAASATYIVIMFQFDQKMPGL